MSVEPRVPELIQDSQDEEETSAANTLNRVVEEVKTLFRITKDSLADCCMRVEGATSRQSLMSALRQFDKIMRFFLETSVTEEEENLVVDAVCSFEMSQCLRSVLDSEQTLGEAITSYKTTVARELAAALQHSEQMACADEEFNKQLVSQFLPNPVEHLPEPRTKVPRFTASRLKRGVSALAQDEEMTLIPKRQCTIPALASILRVPGGGGDGTAVRRNVLLTREKLRAGLHDPKGLLDLEGPSTNAIERTKRLELLKSSGLLVKNQSNRPFTRLSFSDKLNEAKVRLALGLGGQSVRDTLTFGAKVLSSPGFLTPKNISDVENGVVEANTT